jgi:hypothetical protein
MTTCLSDPQVRFIDTGGPTITVSLIYPDGVEISRKVRPEQAEGRNGRDLIEAMKRAAEARRGR